MPLFTRLRGIGILRTSRSRSSQKFAPRNSHLAYENSPYGANLATKCATYSGTKAVGEPGLAAKPLPWVGCEGYSGKPLATALGLLRTGEEGKDALVHPTERRLRGDVAAALEELGQGEVGEDLFCPREDSPGGEERVLLGGEHRNRLPEARELLLGGRPGEVGVQPEVPEGGPELPDGRAEGGVLGLREQRHCRAPEPRLGGTQAVDECGGADLAEDPQEGACGYAGWGDERRPGDALGGESHGPDRYGRPVGEAHERRTLQAEAV